MTTTNIPRQFYTNGTAHTAKIQPMAFSFDWQLITALMLGAGMGVAVAVALMHGRHARSQATGEHLRERSATLEAQLASALERNAALSTDNAGLTARLASEQQRYQEQLALLTDARNTLGREFENIANRIFEDKQAIFNRSSKQVMDSTVDPLRRELSEFRKKIDDSQHKESAERNRLIGQISELQKQAQRIGDDAVMLATALKGDSKVQGNWGEVVLERLLEESGLRKGREYETQVSLKDDAGRRRSPDVILRLPDKRDIVIDAKVSLTDYERYCRSDDEDARMRHLNQHIMSIRNHITGLSRKAYEQLEGINTLDFVLIFVPIEAAFMVAIERDQTLFRDAYDRGIILVSPSTLMATLRTINNIWRYADQNRNAEKIATQAAALYDQFVLVVQALEEVGKHLDKSQEAWALTRNRLSRGKGNLVKRMDDLKTLGAPAKREMPAALREEGQAEDENAQLTQVPPGNSGVE